MVKSHVLFGFVAVLALAASPVAAGVVISEIQTVGNRTLLDGDRETPDWIELYNDGAEPVNLEGWHLTDDPFRLDRWTFPAVTLPPGEFLIVFASEKDYRDPASDLHTDFRLESEGEFLALTDPTETVVSYFVPEFPPQVESTSFGRHMELSAAPLILEGVEARYLVPSDSSLANTWIQPEFDDAAWARGPTGIGFDSKAEPTYTSLIRTDVGAQMANINSSIYVRIPFTVPDPGGAKTYYRLRLKYDDGVVVWVNGTEVARRLVSTTAPRYNSRALSEHSEAEAVVYEDILLGGPTNPVRTGSNVLAIQTLNATNANLDLLLVPVLEAVVVQSVQAQSGEFYEVPSPGFPNLGGLPGVAPEPQISLPNGAYPAGLTVEITVASAPGAVVRYTLDGKEPGRNSTVYSGPIALDGNFLLRARTFQTGLLPSPVAARNYLLLSPATLEFTSNIPIVIGSTFGVQIQGSCDGPYISGQIMVFLPGEDGRTRLTSEAHLAESAGFRRRGSSTCGNAKFSTNVEFRDAFGGDKDVQIFDFPIESDYILYAPNNFDRALIRNPVAYWLSREVGPWAARTRNVEFFWHPTQGAVTNASYFGVYNFMEKNKRHPEKINVERLNPRDATEPTVAGGYVLRRDRTGSGEVTTSAGGYGSLVFVYPKQPSAPQRAYITNNINRAIASLSPNIGRQEDTDLIDFGEFLDHHILCWYPKNVDAFRLSGYMHKKRAGLFAMGPVWDYDRTMGCSDDDRARSPEGYNNDGVGDGGTLYFGSGNLGSWYSILFQNAPPSGPSPWAQAYRARWRELRNGPLGTENILAQIDAWSAELQESSVRNFQKWPALRPRFGSFQGEIDHLKNWLAQRADWIDSEFIEAPTLSHASGQVDRGTQVEITASEGDLYYTVNGPDPMAPTRLPAAEAVRYTGPITIDGTTRLRARTRVSERVWSGMVEAVYVIDLLPLVITEIMYNPGPLAGDTSSPTQYEFVEVQNIGTEPVSLAGVRLLRAPATLIFDFSTGSIPSLGPGEYAVVVKNVQAFGERYPGAAGRVAGITIGFLSNRTQPMLLSGPLGEPLLSFAYDNTWYPESDGQGRSLVIRDPHFQRARWNEAGSWRASLELGGSPGRDDVTAGGLQVPGDLSQDGRLSIGDALRLFAAITGDAGMLPCSTPEGNTTLTNINGDARVDLADVLALMNYLFLDSAPPALGLGCVPIEGCSAACAAR